MVKNTYRALEFPANYLKYISFIDGYYRDLLEKKSINIPNVYDLSLRFGTEKLLIELEKLIEVEGYDLVLGVDVGGDILARERGDKEILSPLMDFSALYLLGRLSVDAYLVEFGLGTDGELGPGGMEDIFEELKSNDCLLGESELSIDDEEVEIFMDVYSHIAEKRQGQTARMLIKILKEEKKDWDCSYRYDYRLNIGEGVMSWRYPYLVCIPKEFCRKIWLIDVKKLAAMRKSTAFSYLDPIEQFLKLKRANPYWKTEYDLLYYWSDYDRVEGQGSGLSMLLLTSSTHIYGSKRLDILSYADQTGEDLILILEEDWEYFRFRPDLDSYAELDGFMVLINKKKLNQLRRKCEYDKEFGREVYENFMEKLKGI